MRIGKWWLSTTERINRIALILVARIPPLVPVILFRTSTSSTICLKGPFGALFLSGFFSAL
jgi:hypothetical protein